MAQRSENNGVGGSDIDRFSLLAEVVLPTCREACGSISEVVRAIYEDVNNSDGDSDSDGPLSTRKADSSYFTVADGLVQALLFRLLSDVFVGMVGEEDVDVHFDDERASVAGMEVPARYFPLVVAARDRIDLLQKTLLESSEVDSLRALECFIDPIDGTREFVTGLGHQCTVLIGFAYQETAVGGLVYRPMTNAWAAGCAAVGYAAHDGLDILPTSERDEGGGDGFVVSNSRSLSSFMEGLKKELGMKCVRSGGAGNKALLLLEGKGRCYIQDRGVSRWDTCATEAVMRAHGGSFVKLTDFLSASEDDDNDDEVRGYTYKAGATINLDPNPLAAHTKYNTANFGQDDGCHDGDRPFKIYSNLCGQVCLAPGEDSKFFRAAMQKVLDNGAVIQYD